MCPEAMSTSLHDAIAETVIQKFLSLPKAGKPNETEWTVLAGIVAVQHGTQAGDGRGPHEEADPLRIAVISLATGTKCLNPSKLSPDGQVLNDSHGEVLARRGFIRALHLQIEWLLSQAGDGGSYDGCLLRVERSSDTFRICLREDVSLHLYVSQAPCGDASIFEVPEAESTARECAERPKRLKISTDDHRFVEISDCEWRTGAKAVGPGPWATSDPARRPEPSPLADPHPSPGVEQVTAAWTQPAGPAAAVEPLQAGPWLPTTNAARQVANPLPPPPAV